MSRKEIVNYKFVKQDEKITVYNFINIGSNQVHKKGRKIRSCKFFTVREMGNYKIVN
jgi:hypothetical protein